MPSFMNKEIEMGRAEGVFEKNIFKMEIVQLVDVICLGERRASICNRGYQDSEDTLEIEKASAELILQTKKMQFFNGRYLQDGNSVACRCDLFRREERKHLQSRLLGQQRYIGD